MLLRGQRAKHSIWAIIVVVVVVTPSSKFEHFQQKHIMHWLVKSKSCTVLKGSIPAVIQSLCNTSGSLEFEMDDVPTLERPLLACQKVQRLPKMMKNEYQVQYIILV